MDRPIVIVDSRKKIVVIDKVVAIRPMKTLDKAASEQDWQFDMLGGHQVILKDVEDQILLAFGLNWSQ